MAINVLTTTIAGVTSAPSQVTSSETISGNLVSSGAKLMVTNGSGSSINVTFTDPGRTQLGNTGTQPPVAVANGQTKFFDLTPGLVDAASNNIVVGFSATGVTITGQIIV